MATLGRKSWVKNNAKNGKSGTKHQQGTDRG